MPSVVNLEYVVPKPELLRVNAWQTHDRKLHRRRLQYSHAGVSLSQQRHSHLKLVRPRKTDVQYTTRASIAITCSCLCVAKWVYSPHLWVVKGRQGPLEEAHNHLHQKKRPLQQRNSNTYQALDDSRACTHNNSPVARLTPGASVPFCKGEKSPASMILTGSNFSPSIL